MREFIFFLNQPVAIPRFFFARQPKLLKIEKLYWTYVLILFGLISGIKLLGVTEPLDLNIYDRFVSIQNHKRNDPRLLVVAITEEDIAEFGWPISDQVLAKALNILQSYEPKAIGLDIYRHHSDATGESDLGNQLKQPNLVAVTFLGDRPKEGKVPPPQDVSADRVGFNDLLVDSDGVLRRNLLVLGGTADPKFSFALRLGLQYAGLDDSAIDLYEDRLIVNQVTIPVLNPHSGNYHNLDASGYQILLRYLNQDFPGQEVSLGELLDMQVDPSWIKGKVIIIGSTADSLRDLFLTPYSSWDRHYSTMPGVIVHAQATSQVLDSLEGMQAIYRFWPGWGEWIWMWFCGFASFYFVWRITNPLKAMALSGLLIASVLGIGYFSLLSLVWMPISEPIVAISIASVLGILTKLLYRSFYDELTQLPNREAFLSMVQYDLTEISSKLKDNHAITIAYININRFKLINESLGYKAGNQLLLMVVDRIKEVTEPDYFLARAGGDEFALLFRHLNQKQVLSVVNQIKKKFQEPFLLSEKKIIVNTTIGIVSTDTRNSSRPESILQDAQIAMYRSKATGKSEYSVFEREITESAMKRLTLESRLLDAIEKQEFVVYYQPIVNLQTKSLSGFEALARWQTSESEIIFPDKFIPILEETGLITRLGQWLLNEICQQLQDWRKTFSPESDLFISFNLSNRQFSDSGLIDSILLALSRYQIPANLIRLEITESMVMEDLESSLKILNSLKSVGVKLAIDDFGTGYSSLNYLKKLPFDILKLDKSFVRKIHEEKLDRDIVETIISLGQKMDLVVVAEGIETKEVVEILAGRGCHFGQGFFFAKPLPKENATSLLMQCLNQDSYFDAT